MDKFSKTCKELLIGIGLFGLLFQAILGILVYCNIVNRFLYTSIGLWAGVALAAVFALHMDHSVQVSVELGESRASKYQISQYAVRILLLAAVLFALVYSEIGSLYAAFVGLLTLKFAAYLNPVLSGVLSNKK